MFNFLCYVNADGIHTLKAERGRYYEEMRLGLRSCSGYLQLGQEVISVSLSSYHYFHWIYKNILDKFGNDKFSQFI